MSRIAIISGLCALLLLPCAGAQTTLRVSPTGSATNTVTLEQALAKLKDPALRDANGGPKEDIVVQLESGTYRLAQTLKLDIASSGSTAHPVTISGPQDGSAIISGGRAVNGFEPVTDPAVLARLPAVARAHVMQSSLRQQGITDFGVQLRHGFGSDAGNPTALAIAYRNQPMTLARWPNSSFATIASTPDGEKGLGFTLQGANTAAWQSEPNLLATGYWFNNWADTTARVAAVDTTNGLLTLTAPAPPYGIKAGQRVFIQNALAELDEAGEWYLDVTSGTLYLWPITTPQADEVEASVLTQLLHIANASHITFDHLTFQSSRGDAITVRGGHHIRIANATLRNIGGRGAVIGGENSGVAHMLIENIGAGAIVLQGGDRQTLTPANLYAERSTIRRFAQVSRTYQPAVLINGVGNRVEGNTITDSAHTAILFTGNDHLIARNDISNVCLETGDAGVIYTGRDWTARGTVIAHNHLHDIPPNISWGRTKGVYLDDQASGIIIRKNQFDKIDQAVFIGGGRDNLIEENIFNGGEFPIHLDARGRNWQLADTEDKQGTLQTRLKAVPYKHRTYSDRYPHLATILEDELGAPKYNIAKGNYFFGASLSKQIEQ